MFSVSLRAAMLAGKANAKSQPDKKTGEALTWLSFDLEEIKIGRDLVCALLREPHAFEALYNTGANPIEPILRGLKSLELAESIVKGYVRVDVGVSGYTRFDFKDCKISKIKLALRQGGDTALSCKVSVAPELNGKLSTLLEFLGHSVQVELRGEAPGAQVDMPLNTFGGDKPPPTTDKAKRRAPRARGNDAVN